MRIRTRRMGSEAGKPGKAEQGLAGRITSVSARLMRRANAPAATARIETPRADEPKIQRPLAWIYDLLGIQNPRLLARMTDGVQPTISANLLLQQLRDLDLNTVKSFRFHSISTAAPGALAVLATISQLEKGLYHFDAFFSNQATSSAIALLRLQVNGLGGGSATWNLGYLQGTNPGNRWDNYVYVPDCLSATMYLENQLAFGGTVYTALYVRRVV